MAPAVLTTAAAICIALAASKPFLEVWSCVSAKDIKTPAAAWPYATVVAVLERFSCLLSSSLFLAKASLALATSFPKASSAAKASFWEAIKALLLANSALAFFTVWKVLKTLFMLLAISA